MSNQPSRRGRRAVTPVVAAALFGWLTAASAQDPGIPDPLPAANPAATPGGEVADRLAKVEEMNRRLLAEFERISKQNSNLAAENSRLSKKVDDLSEKVEEKDRSETVKEERAAAEVVSGSRATTSATAGSGGGVRNRAGAQVVGNRQIGNLRLKADYDYDNAGYKFSTEDDEFTMRVRGVFQGEGRLYQQGNQDPVSSGFYIPRARLYFTGHMTKPIQYQLSFQHGYGNFDILNAYLNFDFDRRLQFRFGRFKVPYTYEYYKISFMDLLAPERSLYNNNFGINRSIGGQFWGEVFGERLEYAVGVFNGGRKSYQPYNNSADLAAFLNARPFRQTDSALRNLNLGGSGVFGHENNPLTPSVLRTSETVSSASLSSTEASNSAAVPFLAFHNNVREKGARSLWDLHFAYFYKALSLLGSWSGGFDSYAASGGRPVRVPVNGYFVQFGYILTGETLTESTVIDPLHPFDLRPGHFGLGAFQPTARFSELNIGRQVFSGGLADPNLWTNQADMVDVGMNWYLNKMTKVYLDWEHVVFGQPVYAATGPRLQKTSDLFWLRLQFQF